MAYIIVSVSVVVALSAVSMVGILLHDALHKNDDDDSYYMY